MKYAQVVEIYLNDDAEFGPYSIQALLKESTKSQRIVAIPLNINQKHIPVVGEYVCVQKAPSDRISAFGGGKTIFYYSTPISLQGNVNNNILENATQLKTNSVGSDYSITSLGVPNPSSIKSTDKKNKEFIEVSNISQLQPYAGDVIHEGRFGQSIRLGYTPQNSDSKIKPSWNSTTSESPITIIRNGGQSNGYNKFVIEDINKDDSSIWLGSKQTIGLKPSNGFSLDVIPQNVYNKPQLVFNSDRVVINSKSDSVLISGAKSVNVSTPSWKADMDVMFNQIEALKNQLNTLNTQMSILVNTVNPLVFGALTPIGTQLAGVTTNLVKITTQLTLMKQ